MDPIAVARTYTDALISHDAESVLLADDARRIDNGKVTVEGAAALRSIIRREPAAATAAFRWLVDDDQVIVFYDLDADMADPRPGPEADWIPAYIGERFQVRSDRIEEIEVVYTARPGHPRPPRPSRQPAGTDERATVLAAAKAYVAALVTHDASAVPLATDVWRIENGQVTADGADDLRRSLESEIMHTVSRIEDQRWFADGDRAAVFYRLIAEVGGDEMPVRIAEWFRVVDGSVAEIEAVFAPIPEG